MGMVIGVRVVIVKMQFTQKETLNVFQKFRNNFDFFYDSYAHPDHSTWRSR